MRLSRWVTGSALVTLLLCACARSSSLIAPTPTSPPRVPASQDCRTYATAWAQTSTFGDPRSITASFNTTTHVYAETIAGTSLALRRTTYASTSDFVDEPGLLGRVLYSQTATCPTAAGCWGALADVETPLFDVTRRKTGAIHSVNGATLFADTFTQWDPSGRPVAGVRAQTGVCNVPLTIEYNEAARTVTETAVGSGSILCAVASTVHVVSYDANGSVLSDTGSVGGTSTTISNTIGTRQQVCK